jgi:branched-chain amino acid transport system permease protein
MSAPLARAIARLGTHGWIVPVVATALVAVAPQLGLTFYWQGQVAVIVIYTLLVSGLNLSFGYAGELALGQVAIFAAGAYATAILQQRGVVELAIVIPIALAVAALAGLATGIPGLRLGHWSLALTSFFLVLLIPNLVVVFEKWTGGQVGISGIFDPTLFGYQLDVSSYYVALVLLSAVWMFVLRNLVVSRFGQSLKVLRESPILAESLGASAHRLRISAYVISGLPAGLAGVLFAYQGGFVNPESFTMTMVVALLAASVVGGSASVWGAPIGAALLVLGPLQTQSFQQYSLVVYGLFLLVLGALFRQGIAGMTSRWWRRLAVDGDVDRRSVSDDRTPAESLRITGGLLQARGISKSFGGNRALNGADLSAAPGTVTAILGANGAGKTTLLNVVSGLLKPDSGTVALDADQLVGLSGSAVARHGVSRTFQTPIIPRDMTVVEVVETGGLRHFRSDKLQSILRTPSWRRSQAQARAQALTALRFAGLEHLAHHDATGLPLGTRRLLEVVRAIVGQPRVVLLDEPAAGLDDRGLQELGELVRRSRDAGATVIIVEHNVKFVLGLADRVYVMDLGGVIAVGAPEEIRSDPQVIASYLGTRTGSAHPPGDDVTEMMREDAR